ncbi:MAG: hypothetical protein U0401_00135 [Anaerolineae bacterium]
MGDYPRHDESLYRFTFSDLSLVGVIGIPDIMRTAARLANQHFRQFEFYTAAAVIYVIIILLSPACWWCAERHFRYQTRSVWPCFLNVILSRRRRIPMVVHQKVSSLA